MRILAVPDKINSSDLKSCDFQACPGSEIINKLLSLFRFYQFNLFITDNLAYLPAYYPCLFQHIYYKYKRNIGENKLNIRYLGSSKTIDYRNTDNHKQVGHLLDGNRIRPVADDAKNGKQT